MEGFGREKKSGLMSDQSGVYATSSNTLQAEHDSIFAVYGSAKVTESSGSSNCKLHPSSSFCPPFLPWIVTVDASASHGSNSQIFMIERGHLRSGKHA